TELQVAVRFSMFHCLQAAARAEQRAIPAKGLTGPGYEGHTFWDTEMFVLPVLSYTVPEAARDALHWRHDTLDLARDRAAVLGLKGAAFPWRTIRGQECSSYWPAGTAAFHINAAVADAVRRYVTATDDVDFESGPGIELLVETARMWRSLGHHDTEGNFRIDGVTGPDEYSAVVDNNTFTNLMAARNLRCAADCVERYPDRAVELGVDDDTLSSWRAAAGAMVIPFDAELGVTAQAEGFTRYRKWDFAGTDPADYPLLMNVPYYRLYSSQVAKQADLVMALYACGDGFTAEQKQRDFAYYEAITVRDSSLSAAIQAIVAVEVGHMDLAYEYFRETAFVDLRNRAGNTADGLHLASLAGSWMVAVNGFGGMRDQGDQLCFAPRLPAAMDRLTFRLGYRGRQLRVELRPDAAAYELRSGAPLDIVEHGEIVTLTAGEPLVRPYPPFDPPPPVSPPPGRDAFGTGVGVEVVDSRN
ncbi:MAG: glycoside hydrolase family 65 protein, partial [Acidimicrobiia bacterium]|nr:glycoside hydrolase family 65 protein [Acidimicrobiia bacterium]